MISKIFVIKIVSVFVPTPTNLVIIKSAGEKVVLFTFNCAFVVNENNIINTKVIFFIFYI